MNSASVASGTVFALVDANREPHVDCGVHGTPFGWTPEASRSSREPVATELYTALRRDQSLVPRGVMYAPTRRRRL